MKKILIVLILTLGLNAENKVASDKASHLMVGTGIYVGCLLFKGGAEALHFDMSYLTSTTCLIPVIVAGVGKELYDANHEGHEAEFADLAYTVAVPLGMSIVLYEW